MGWLERLSRPTNCLLGHAMPGKQAAPPLSSASPEIGGDARSSAGASLVFPLMRIYLLGSQLAFVSSRLFLSQVWLLSRSQIGWLGKA